MECGGDQHPCQTSWAPGGSYDDAVNECMCIDNGWTHCCNDAWDDICVMMAQEMCDVTCADDGSTCTGADEGVVLSGVGACENGS